MQRQKHIEGVDPALAATRAMAVRVFPTEGL